MTLIIQKDFKRTIQNLVLMGFFLDMLLLFVTAQIGLVHFYCGCLDSPSKKLKEEGLQAGKVLEMQIDRKSFLGCAAPEREVSPMFLRLGRLDVEL